MNPDGSLASSSIAWSMRAMFLADLIRLHPQWHKELKPLFDHCLGIAKAYLPPEDE